MVEREIEDRLYSRLVSSLRQRSLLRDILVSKSSWDGVRSLADLLGDVTLKVFKDTSEWKQDSAWERSRKEKAVWLQDISGGSTPDLVLRSDKSGENRVIIEVKKEKGRFHSDKECPQIARYFLHLLVATRRCPAEQDGCTARHPRPCPHDARRALLMAAPASWFAEQAAAEDSRWAHFVKTFSPLATNFDITLGEIHTDFLFASAESSLSIPKVPR